MEFVSIVNTNKNQLMIVNSNHWWFYLRMRMDWMKSWKTDQVFRIELIVFYFVFLSVFMFLFCIDLLVVGLEFFV